MISTMLLDYKFDINGAIFDLEHSVLAYILFLLVFGFNLVEQ